MGTEASQKTRGAVQLADSVVGCVALQVANTLAKEVLTAPGNEVAVVNTNQVRPAIASTGICSSGSRVAQAVGPETMAGAAVPVQQQQHTCRSIPRAPNCSIIAPTQRECSLCHSLPAVAALLVLQRDLNGHTYYEFEYTAKNNRYTRHSLAVVVANDGEGNCWATRQPYKPCDQGHDGAGVRLPNQLEHAWPGCSV